MRKKHLVLFLLICVLLLTAGIDSTMAYFSSYTTASGGYPVTIDNNPEPEESYSSGQKKLAIKNNGDAPIFVRAKVIASEGVTLEYTEESQPPFWTPDNLGGAGGSEYYYYRKALNGKAGDTCDATAELVITITFPSSKEGDEVNVLVLFESVPAVFNEDGSEDFETAWQAGPVTVMG